MNPQAADELVRLTELVQEGKLPETAIPRLFYLGHKFLYGIYVGTRTFRCIACGKDTIAQSLPEKCKCGNNELFDITNDKEAKWQCVQCEHEWVSEDGTRCPSCGLVKNS